MADNLEQIAELLRRTMVHYGLWFSETRDQLGLEKALKAEQEAGDRWTSIALKRIVKLLGRPDLTDQQMAKLEQAMAVNWLAADGVWFQAVESAHGMKKAKDVNDACWSSFSPLEAARIKALCELPENGGLEALKEAFRHRLYARVNTQEIVEETDTSFVFRMTGCRVQDARKRKGLDDYPCKSGGMVEYTTFARTIDPRIKTECVACPPDTHPEGWWCAWKFTLDK